jgi:dethiobiotin synthetase
MKQFFITGTGTDIGKTLITAGISALASENNLTTAVMKPVQTGTDEYQTDYDFVENLVPEIAHLPKSLSQPYKFKLPASPHLAAAQEKKEIDPDYIKQQYIHSLSYPYDILLVEGAGGLMVPVTEQFLMIDLMKDFDIPVILVTDAGLGTINHTLLSIEVLKSRDIQIAGLIFNRMPGDTDVIAEDNVRIISKLSQVPLLACIKTFSEPVTFDSLVNEFKKHDKLKNILFEN